MNELIERLRAASNRHYRKQAASGVTCRHALASVSDGCRDVRDGHECRLTDPHPPGYSHECRCGIYW